MFCKLNKLSYDNIMVHKKNKYWSGCPIRFTMKHFGDKWSFLVVRDMMFKGKKYYNEFLEAGEGISTNILASRLRDLEKHGVISKIRDPEKKSKVLYSLTSKGKELIPVMLAMIEWGSKHDPNTEAPQEFIENLRNNPEKIRQDILKRLE